MKTLLSILFVFVTISSFSQSYYIGAGATYSEEVSYYATIGTTKKMSDHSGFLGEIQFISQKSGMLENNSLNGTFAYRFYPIKNLSLNAGFQIGVYGSHNVTDESEPLSQGKMDAVAGISYSIKRFEIVTRYNHPLSNVFGGLYQAGINFTFSR